MSKQKKRLWGLIAAGLLLLCILLNSYLNSSTQSVHNYGEYLFLPLQKLKAFLFYPFGFSIGDLFYFGLIIALFWIITNILIGLFQLKSSSKRLKNSLALFLGGSLFFYFIFLFSWGGNYKRNDLLPISKTKEKQILNSQNDLVKLNRFLISQLNSLKPQVIEFKSIKDLNPILLSEYKNLIHTPIPPLKVKATLLGSWLGFIGVQGYYNPWTGEAQISKALPPFMYPFVMAHEMSHQMGIAAEDQANLLSYVVTTKSTSHTLQYSGYFNAFLYTYSKLMQSDTNVAEKLWEELNLPSQQDYDELMAYYKSYKSPLKRFTNAFYDTYLKTQGLDKGLKTYSSVVPLIFFWEFHLNETFPLNLYGTP